MKIIKFQKRVLNLILKQTGKHLVPIEKTLVVAKFALKLVERSGSPTGSNYLIFKIRGWPSLAFI